MSDMAIELQRRPISVEEYHRMLDVGILADGERIELLRGDLVRKVTVGNRHRACLNRTARLLRVLEDRCVIQVQLPIVLLDDSEPEPNLALLAMNDASLQGTRDVTVRDVFALIEVSDTSRDRDVRYKSAVYAEAGVPEYWVVDLMERVVHVNRDPDRQEKRFRITTVARAPESLAFASFPDVFAVSEMLG